MTVCLLPLLFALASCVSGEKGKTGYGRAYVSIGGSVKELSAPARTSALPSDVTRVTVTCTGAGMTAVEADLPLDGTPVLLEVPAGSNRVFTARAYAGTILRMEGQETVASISPGEEITVTITLYDLATIAITPSSAEVTVGGQQQFTAQVTAHADTSVTWSVNGIQGGNSTYGTIDSNGLYTAPASVPSPPTVTIRATSNADTTLYAEATVTVKPPTSSNEWMRTYGEIGKGLAVAETSDGGFIVIGSFGALKVNSKGFPQWRKIFSYCDLKDLDEVSSWEYVAVGVTNGYQPNACAVRFKDDGSMVWHKAYDVGGGLEVEGVEVASDGGFLAVGNKGFDAWAMKVDSSGNVVWSKTYGGSKFDKFYSVVQTSDGGFVLAGETRSSPGFSDAGWVLKLDGTGNPIWSKAMGPNDPSYSYGVFEAVTLRSNGELILSGYASNSSDAGTWVVEMTPGGSVAWSKIYSIWGYGKSVSETSDGGYLIASSTGDEGYLLKFDSNGVNSWAKEYTFGSSLGEKLLEAMPVSGGGYVAVGGADPFDLDWSDFLWLIKTSPTGDVGTSCYPVTNITKPSEKVLDTSVQDFQVTTVNLTGVVSSDVSAQPIDGDYEVALFCQSVGDYCLGEALDVDSTADAVDINPGDGFCEDAGGNCTLRAAIMESNGCIGPDEINIPPGTYIISIAGQGEDLSETGDLDILDEVRIAGGGAGSVVIDGGGLDRVFHVKDSGSPYSVEGRLTLSGVTIRNGTADDGGGIYVHGGDSLRLENSTVEQCVASGNGGGLYAMGYAEIVESVIRQNEATGEGGGICLYLFGSVTLGNSTVEGNRGNNGGGIASIGYMSYTYSGSYYENDSKLTVEGSTISGNVATGSGGGIYFRGSGSRFPYDVLIVRNSTISGNTAGGNGGGAYTISRFYKLEFWNATITSNSASNSGSGYYGYGDFYNTIIANQASGSDCAWVITGVAGNLDSDGSCGFGLTADPLLGPLQDNGGPTLTHALLPGSPAIDAGDSNYCPATDQRGVERSDGACDIGAYEYP